MHLVPQATQQPSGQQRPPRDPPRLIPHQPVQMASHDFFRRFVSIFQELGGTLLDDADNVDNVVDVTVAPPEFVRWVGSWIASAPIDSELPDGLQRRMVQSAASALTWRGTRAGLTEFLEQLSGGAAEVTDGGGVWRLGEGPDDVAWVRLHVESTGQLSTAEFIELVKDEIPAHVRAELTVGSERVWSSEEGDAR
jgi:phage tail-like protein